MTAPFAAFALMLGNFVIGVSVMLPAGMLPQLAEGLAVTIRDAGLLVTYGAVVLCFGSPLMAWATARLERRTLLGGTVLLLATGHALSAMLSDYAGLLALRFVMMAAAAVYTPQAAATIGLIVPAKERPSAISFVFLGWSLAVAAGLPLVTFLAAQFGWRAAYAAVATCAALCLILLAVGLPRGLQGTPLSLESWGAIARNRLIVLILAVTGVATAGQFGLFVYLGPLLTRMIDAGPRTIGFFFAISGIAAFVGNVVATRIVFSFGAYGTSLIFLGLLLAGLVIWSVGGESVTLLALGMTVMGLGFAAANSMQQARLAAAAPPLAGASIALNTSSIYVGQALGSYLAGALYAHDLPLLIGYVSTAIMAVALALAASTRSPVA